MLARLIVLAFVSAFLLGGKASAATPEANYESAPNAHAMTAQHSPDDQKWAFLVFVQGMGAQSGVALGLETPAFLDDLFSLRPSVSINSLKNSGTDATGDLSVSYGAAQLGFKIHLNHESTMGVYEAVLININYFMPPSDSRTTGSLWGDEVCYQLEWRHRYMDGWTNAENDFAGFIEMGLADSGFRASDRYGSGQIENGFIARLGFRRFF